MLEITNSNQFCTYDWRLIEVMGHGDTQDESLINYNKKLDIHRAELLEKINIIDAIKEEVVSTLETGLPFVTVKNN